MSSTKKLQKAAKNFKKENHRLHFVCSLLLSHMSKLIANSGVAEVTVGIKNGSYYEEYANN